MGEIQMADNTTKHSSRYNYDKKKGKPVHRQKVEEVHYRLSQADFANIQSTYSLSGDLREIYNKVRGLDKANDTWYTSRTGGKTPTITKTITTFKGVTRMEDKRCGAFQKGKKTTRMESRTKKANIKIGSKKKK